MAETATIKKKGKPLFGFLNDDEVLPPAAPSGTSWGEEPADEEPEPVAAPKKAGNPWAKNSGGSSETVTTPKSMRAEDFPSPHEAANEKPKKTSYDARGDTRNDDGPSRRDDRDSYRDRDNNRDSYRDRDNNRDNNRDSFRDRDNNRDSYRDRDNNRDGFRDNYRDNNRNRDDNRGGDRYRDDRYSRDERPRFNDRDRDAKREREERREREPAPIPDSAPFTAFFGNIPFDTKESEVKDFFDDNNIRVKGVRLQTDRETERPKGFGYVEFESREDLVAAIDLNGSDFLGREVRIDVAEGKKTMTGGRGDRDRENRFAGGDDPSDWRATMGQKQPEMQRDERRRDDRRDDKRDFPRRDRDSRPEERKERPVLNLKPRSEDPSAAPATEEKKSRPNPFGNAKPADTDSILKKKEEEWAKREKEDTPKSPEKEKEREREREKRDDRKDDKKDSKFERKDKGSAPEGAWRRK